MTHLEPDDLAVLALGEPPTPEQEAHLRDCPGCADELAELGAAVRLGRAADVDERLVRPAPHVWAAVRQELGLAEEGRREPARSAPVPRGRRRRLVLAGVAVLAVGALLGAGVPALTGLLADRPEVLARASLAALPGWSGASGTAELERLAAGRLAIRVHVRTPAVGGDYRELWLLTADGSAAVSLGVVDRADGVFSVPGDVDLAEYDVVDLSREAPDGNPAHSHRSIVRGVLRR